MFLFLSFVCLSIYTQLIGSKDGICHIDHPCDYQTALRKIKSGTKIFIRDKYISSKQQIDSFKVFVEKASKNNCSIIGRGTIINTITYPKTTHLFDIKNTDSFVFCNFTFINIKSPLLKISNSNRATISNFSISSTSLINSTSLMTIHKSNVLIRYFSIQQSTFDNTFLMKMDKSSVLLFNSSFIQNFIFHETENPFIALKNSIFIIKDSNFLYSSSPNSPFITVLSNTSVSIINSDFINENHKCLIKANNDMTQINIFNSTFNCCYGSIVYLNNTGIKMEVLNSTFHHNFAPCNPLFNVNNGVLYCNSSNFIDNSGDCLLFSNNSLSRIIIIKTTFNENKNSLATFTSCNKGLIQINDCNINENYAGDSIFTSFEGKLIVKFNHFMQNPTKYLFANSSDINITSNEFDIGNHSNGILFVANMSKTIFENNVIHSLRPVQGEKLFLITGEYFQNNIKYITKSNIPNNYENEL